MDEILERLAEIKGYALLAAKDMLTVEEAALYLGLSKSRVYKMTFDHEVPYYKPNGKTVYFEKADLTAWMHKNRVESVAEAEGRAASHILATKARGRAAAR